MKFRDSAVIQCPYCWQKMNIEVDPSVKRQEYVEDCQICCRPMSLIVDIDDKGRPHISVAPEDG